MEDQNRESQKNYKADYEEVWYGGRKYSL